MKISQHWFFQGVKYNIENKRKRLFSIFECLLFAVALIAIIASQTQYAMPFGLWVVELCFASLSALSGAVIFDHLTKSSSKENREDFDWSVKVNSVDVGQISESKLRLIQHRVDNDIALRFRHYGLALRAIYRFLNSFLLALPAILLGLVVIWAYANPTDFLVFMDDVQYMTVEDFEGFMEVMASIFGFLFLMVGGSLFIFGGMQFSKRNIFREERDRLIRMLVDCPSDGSVFLNRTNAAGEWEVRMAH